MTPEINRLINRLNKRTVRRDGCWLFTGSKSKRYGQIWFRGRLYLVHRIAAYLCLNLDLDKVKDQANHKTFCPHRNCWNPMHVYAGTQRDNMRDWKTERV